MNACLRFASRYRSATKNSNGRSKLLGSHQRKEDNVANRRAVGQQHHQPVDADALRRPSAAAHIRARGCSPRPSREPRHRRPRGRQAVPRSAAAARPGSFSSLNALATSKPPMYSSNRSTVSGSSGFCLESGDTSVGNRRRTSAATRSCFVQPLEYFGRDLARSPRRQHLEVELARKRRRSVRPAQVLVVDGRVQALAGFHTGSLAQRHAAIWRRQRDLMVAKRDLLGSDRLARACRQHLLGHDHQLLVIAVGLVELEHREFRIVLRRDALIPEVTIDLIDAFETADDEPLQVQLGRNAQEQAACRARCDA